MSLQTWQEIIADPDVADGTAIANTTTETILFPDITIPANYMKPNRVLRVTYWGRYSTTGTPTMTFRVRWGGVAGVVVAASGAMVTGSAVTAGMWKVTVDIVCRSVGTAGTFFGVGEAVMGDDATSTVGSATNGQAHDFMGSAGVATPSTAAVDTTADKALSVSAQWGTASASNTITGHVRTLESLN